MTLSQRFADLKRTHAARIVKGIVLGLLVIEIVYVFAANAILLSGAVQKLVNATQSAHLEFGPSYTLFPARVHLTDVRLRYEDHNMQFAFSLSEADVTVRLWWLLKKRFSASKVRASGVSFLFRHKVAQVAGNEEALALYPPIPGFSDPPLLGVPKVSNPDDLWSFELDDVDAKIRELWFMSYRYLGPAQAIGGFQLVPYKNLEVGPARLTLFSGKLNSGADKIVSFDLHGEVDVHLKPVNPEALTGMTVFAPISAAVHLGMRLENLEPVNLYLPKAAELRVTQGGGNLEVAAALEGGKLAPGSSLTYSMIGPVRVEVPPLAAVGPIGLKLSVADTKIARLSLNTGNIVFVALKTQTNPPSIAVAEQAQGVAEFAEIDLTQVLSPSYIRLDVPALTSSHLERINALDPGKRSWQLLGGSAKFAGNAEFREGVSHAEVKGDFEAVQLTLKEHELWGYGKLTATYEANKEDQSSEIKNAELLLNQVTVRSQDRRTPDWWASLSTEHVQLAGPAGKQLGGTIVARAKNADAVLNALDVPGAFRALVPNKPVEVVAKLEQQGEVAHLKLIRANTGTLQVRGEMRRDAQRTSGVFHVEGIAIPVGIELGGVDPGVTLFASKSWFEKHLQALNAPPHPAVARR